MGAAARAHELPARVIRAGRVAAGLGFAAGCEEQVGRLLAVLAAAVPPGGAILELGTGVGIGTSWLASGLGDRNDVNLTTVEGDEARAAAARSLDFPPYVHIVRGDIESCLEHLGQFDLIFADAEGGKWIGLERTLAAVRSGGVLVLDDMDLARYADPAHRDAVTSVRNQVQAHPGFLHVELDMSSGVIIATRLTDPSDQPFASPAGGQGPTVRDGA